MLKLAQRVAINAAVNPGTAEINKCSENIEQLHQEIKSTAIKKNNKAIKGRCVAEYKFQGVFNPGIVLRGEASRVGIILVVMSALNRGSGARGNPIASTGRSRRLRLELSAQTHPTACFHAPYSPCTPTCSTPLRRFDRYILLLDFVSSAEPSPLADGSSPMFAPAGWPAASQQLTLLGLYQYCMNCPRQDAPSIANRQKQKTGWSKALGLLSINILQVEIYNFPGARSPSLHTSLQQVNN